MAGFEYDIGIIGGGAAGLTVASGAAQLGAKSLLVKRKKRWAGIAYILVAYPVKRSSEPPMSII